MVVSGTGAGGATKTTSTVISVAVDSVRGPITVKKEEQFQNGNRNGKGFIGGRYKITRNNKHAYIGVGCAHMPVSPPSPVFVFDGRRELLTHLLSLHVLLRPIPPAMSIKPMSLRSRHTYVHPLFAFRCLVV